MWCIPCVVRVLKEWHARGVRLEAQREVERLHSIYNELVLASARKRRMEDATFLLESAERHGVDLSLHHLQVGATSVRQPPCCIARLITMTAWVWRGSRKFTGKNGGCFIRFHSFGPRATLG